MVITHFKTTQPELTIPPTASQRCSLIRQVTSIRLSVRKHSIVIKQQTAVPRLVSKPCITTLQEAIQLHHSAATSRLVIRHFLPTQPDREWLSVTKRC